MLAARLLVQLEALWGAINQRSILLPAAFVFLWQVRPASPKLIEHCQGQCPSLALGEQASQASVPCRQMKGTHSKSSHAVGKVVLCSTDILK